MALTLPGRRERHIKYDDYVRAVQRCGAWAGGIAGGLLALTWGYTKIGLLAGLVFGACGAFVGTLVGAIAAWLLVPHVLLISLGILAAAASPFVLIWLVGRLGSLF